MRTFAVCLLALVLGALGTAGLAVTGCGQEEQPDAGPPAPEVNEYLVRGEILEMPDPATGSRLRIHHEAIPLFMSREGEIVGMDAMPMFFPLAEGVDLDGYQVGDKVQFTMVVDWEPGWYIESIEKLPADTELFNVFGPDELGG